MIDLRDLIYKIPNLVPEEKSKKWINFFEENIKYASLEASTKYYTNKRFDKTDNYKSIDLSKHYDQNNFKQIADEIFNYIKIMITNYENYLKVKISPAITQEKMDTTNNIRILRYKEGEEITDHLDIGDDNHRASCTLNLHSDYEGGQFSFFSSKHIINLKQGEGMIFPVEQIWIHGVKPVTKGTRYCVNCFLKPLA